MTDQAEQNADKYMCKLAEQRDSIAEQLTDARERLKQATGHNSDACDEASALQEQEDITKQIQRLETRQNRVNQAITRLHKDKEDFGICGACHDDIEDKRLDNDPTVEKCHTCQELEEVKGSHYVGMGA